MIRVFRVRVFRYESRPVKIVLHSFLSPKDCYPQSGLRLCIFDPVPIEIRLDVLTILSSTEIVIITLRKVDERFIQIRIVELILIFI